MIDMNFVLAGKAVFTVSNGKGEHFTYRINKHKTDDIYFAKVLGGTDRQYRYMGVFDKNAHIIHKGTKGMSSTAPSVKVLQWAMKVVDGNAELPDGYKIQHEGKCGRCGKPLTDPKSIEYGLGSVCRGL